MIRRTLIGALSVMAILFFASWCSAAVDSDVNLTDNTIAAAFKVLAKTFTVAVDLDRVKLNNIEKIRKMTDEKFNRRYAKIYNLLKSYPHFCARYGFTESLTKNKAIIKITILDKKTIYEMIDAVPARLIANEFKSYLRARQVDLQKSNLSVQVQQFWNKVTKAATGRER